jgi:hypothetical protein
VHLWQTEKVIVSIRGATEKGIDKKYPENVILARFFIQKKFTQFPFCAMPGKKKKQFPHTVSYDSLILTTHAQVLNNSQRRSNDSSIFRVQSILYGNYDLWNHGQNFITGSIQHIVYSVAGKNIVGEFRLRQSEKGKLKFIGM